MFDVKKFKSAKFEHQTQDVPLPEKFREFFTDPKEKLVWKVRGLTGQELGYAANYANRNKNIMASIEAMAGGTKADMVKAYKDLYGSDATATPQQTAEAIEKMMIASVDPVCDLETAIKVCTVSATAFYSIALAIKLLTDGGMVPGKPKGSGKVQASEPA